MICSILYHICGSSKLRTAFKIHRTHQNSGQLEVDPLYGSTVVFNTKLVRQIYRENDLLIFPNFFFFNFEQVSKIREFGLPECKNCILSCDYD